MMHLVTQLLVVKIVSYLTTFHFVPTMGDNKDTEPGTPQQMVTEVTQPGQQLQTFRLFESDWVYVYKLNFN